MKKLLFTLLKMMVFLLVLFALMRIVFVMKYWSLVAVDEIPFGEIMKGFWSALPLDIATASFMLALPAIYMFVSYAIDKETLFAPLRWYFYLMVAVYNLAAFGDIGIYGEWRTKLSYRALLYLQNPSEVINTAETEHTLLLIVLWSVFTVLFCWLYTKLVEPDFTESEEKEDYKPNVYVLSGSFVLVLGMLFLGMRGGLNEIPITSSKVYYSSHKFANEMCVNPAYYLVENILNSKKVETRAHFNYMDMESAKRRTESLHEIACDSTVNILKIERPNIVVILLESWSADLIESLGGEPGITPNFRELEKDGLLFTNIYASANRSQHAMSSLFGGLPGMPVTTITNHPDKYYAVPSLVKKMDSIGYHTSFYFGGELNYGNILSYLRYNEFDEIVEGKDINKGFFKGKLGYHDTDVMPWYVEQLSRYEQPFFSTLFTQSSHSPYDYPKIFEEIEWPAIEKQYVNSGYYTDIAIGMFMEKAKQQEWYDSTLFVFVADHSHATYKNHRMESFDHHKIPMLIYGEPLQDSLRGMTFDKICGNTDLPATILAQLGMKHDEFIWSKDVFGKCYKPFAFFELNNGLGWKTPEGEFVYSNTGVYIKNTLPEAVRDSVVKDGKAYMQYHFDLFNSY
jgi:phosphoglycerol transferase MdoB-like AlkP superfamily enzyme